MSKDQPESLDKRSVLRKGTLTVCRPHEHVEVRSRRGPVIRVGADALRPWAFDEHQQRARLHGLATAIEDKRRLLVAPVVQHALHQVQITLRGHAIEDAALLQRASLMRAATSDHWSRMGKRVRQVEQDPLRRTIARQHARRQFASATSDVDNQCIRRDDQRFRQRLAWAAVQIGHRAVEGGCLPAI